MPSPPTPEEFRMRALLLVAALLFAAAPDFATAQIKLAPKAIARFI